MNLFPNTYKAASLKSGEVTLVDLPFPDNAQSADALIIRPLHMGVCRADAKEVAESRDIPEDRGPLFGHEFIGIIEFAGHETMFNEGELVTFNPNITTGRTTGFAEYFFIHGEQEALDQAVIHVPERGISNHLWMPEPFACIVHSTDKMLELTGLNNLHNKTVAIIGAGCSGLMFAMYCRYLGADVKVGNRGEARIKFATEREILPPDRVLLLEDLIKKFNTFDIVIIVPTKINKEILKLSADIAKDGGLLHLYGGTQKQDVFPDTDINIDEIRRNELFKEVDYRDKKLKVSGAYGCFKTDFEKGFTLHTENPDVFPLEKLISKQINLNEFPDFIKKFSKGIVDYPGKVVINN